MAEILGPNGLEPEGFQSWYEAMPRQEGRYAAMKEWRRVSGDREAPMPSPDQMAASAKRFAARMKREKRNPLMFKTPTVWLAEHRWEDDIPVIIPTDNPRDDAIWLRRFVAENRREPACLFPTSVRNDLGEQFNGTARYGVEELRHEYELARKPVPEWLKLAPLAQGDSIPAGAKTNF